MVRTPTLNKLQFHPVFRKKCNKFQGKPKKFAQQKKIRNPFAKVAPRFLKWELPGLKASPQAPVSGPIPSAAIFSDQEVSSATVLWMVSRT